MKLYPLSEDETTQLLVLLRKIWREKRGDEQLKRNAKSLFSIMTARIYEQSKPSYLMCKRCGREQIKGTREATRDFVFADICISCNKRENQ